MNALGKGIVVALLHILIVLSLGGKLLYDRATCPRIWVRTGSVDPDLPIRGRYITLSLQVHAPDLGLTPEPKNYYGYSQFVRLSVENGQLVAHKSSTPTGLNIFTRGRQPAQSGSDAYLLSPSVDFFIAEHAELPRLNRATDELWAEVTVPRKGPPRPIQLAIKRGSEWIPLNYR
jgi:hypothetical protein